MLRLSTFSVTGSQLNVPILARVPRPPLGTFKTKIAAHNTMRSISTALWKDGVKGV